ncbi:unnamed protein product [Rodentolepis nana]|uniref:Fucosyltransferase n=1 Tax=Rodentolepis nana TaxID=102285 RepID=A0A0R3TCU3_RODNA|nr:unnamed protein product [Rodentolepis nana]
MHIWVGDIHEYVSSDTELNFSNGMVPIVLGAYREDYENVLPPHSYINVDDFDSIQELAEYLQFLDKNDTAYAQYFAWTKHGRIIKLNRPDCRLCGVMRNINEGNMLLRKPDPKLFTDPGHLCFDRPLLPLKSKSPVVQNLTHLFSSLPVIT